ncbi:Putative ribonuclease H protein [Dendrobium catenatum]|uniref:Ribonuclease H protein n=1 Tax=Dendrobium catenatum TaxID=906689 RepID=A0A2I0X5A8_9ASPA|nr:Putative ribonuclease H protein [Dendrobium catenatum]
MEQAYDYMAWSTLDKVMRIMGFSEKFTHWIIQCITWPKFSLLINGQRTDWIRAESGFRQGCPLSPYLFILCFELLTKGFRQWGADLGIQVARNSERVSHLLYADDILIFAEASRCNAKRILKLLEVYCSWTGQRINCGKSAVMFNRKCPSWRQMAMAKLVGFRKVSSFDYLGLPMVLRRPKRADFGGLIKSTQDKTNLWGSKLLSQAGRALLIKTSLLATPMFLITHTIVPHGVLHEVKKIARTFLWQQETGSRGMHYIAWEELCLPKAQGGLGFRDLCRWQSALRARLAWNFLTDPESMLHRLLVAKYGSDLWKRPHCRYVSTAWRVMQDGAKALRQIIRWEIGNGQEINVLQDTWILDRCIARWPTFVDAGALEDGRVGQLLDRNFYWDVEKVEEIFGTIIAQRIVDIPTLRGSGDDRPNLCYSQASSSVAAMAYGAMMDGGGDFKFLWFEKLKLHPREYFFWWRVLKGAIPCNVWLLRRGLVDSPICPWGCDVEETLDHCVAQCSKLVCVMDTLRRWSFNMPNVSSLDMLLMVLAEGIASNPGIGRIYCYAVYQLWRARNNMSYGRSYRTPSVIAATVLSLLPRTFKMPMLEQWSTIQPLGLPPHKLWCSPLQVGLNSTLTLRCNRPIRLVWVL